MKMHPFSFGVTDWATIAPTGHKGETGVATWRTQHFGDAQNPIRVRMVE